MTKKYQFADKWTPEVVKKGFTAVPNILIRSQGELDITNGEICVIICLLSYKWTEGNPFPSIATIAKATGMATNTVRNHIRSLQRKHLIKRIYRKGKSNEYDFGLLNARLRQLIEEGNPVKKRRYSLSENELKPSQKIDIELNEVKSKPIANKGSPKYGEPKAIGEIMNDKLRRKYD